MSPLEETLERLDMTDMPCIISRRPGSAIITRAGGMQVLLRDIGERLVEIIYERYLHDDGREECEPARAALIARAILSRKRLEPVTLPRE